MFRQCGDASAQTPARPHLRQHHLPRSTVLHWLDDDALVDQPSEFRTFLNHSCHGSRLRFRNLIKYLFSLSLSLFPGKYGSVTLGAIGLTETFSFFALGVMNSLIISAEDINTFLNLFPTLAVVSLVALAKAFLAVPVTTVTVSQDQPE